MKLKYRALVLAMASATLPATVWATNGMNVEGYGPVAMGMGGASYGYDNGAAAMMNNPATLGLMAEGDRVDVAVGFLGPNVTSSAGGATAESGGDAYYMPAAGWVRKRGKLAYGFGVYAQGGMGTEYAAGSLMSAGSGLPTRSELGVGRAILPLSYQVNDKFQLAGSVDFVWAGLDLQMAMTGAQFGDMVAALGGTQTYGAASGSMVDGLAAAIPGAIANVDWAYFNFTDSNDFTGKTKATGLAGKIGMVYKVSPKMNVGMTYHSKTNLGDLKGRAVLSMQVDSGAGGAGVGLPASTNNIVIPMTGEIKVVDFQWPETYGLGMSYQVNDRLMVAADYKRINWQDVMKNFKMTFVSDAVASNGAFGGTTMNATLYQNWDDQDVFEFGFSYKATDALTLRAGANLSNNPVPSKYMNPLFPAIEENHYMAGFGYSFDASSEVNFALSHAPEVTQTNGQGVTVDHSQTSWQLMYSKRF